jgi:hypothetical protein
MNGRLHFPMIFYVFSMSIIRLAIDVQQLPVLEFYSLVVVCWQVLSVRFSRIIYLQIGLQ